MGDAYSLHISFLLPAGCPKLEAEPRSPCSAVPYGAIFQGFALLLFNVFSFLASSDNKFCDHNYVFYFWTILIPVLWEILNNNYYLLWTMWKILFFKNIYYIFCPSWIVSLEKLFCPQNTFASLLYNSSTFQRNVTLWHSSNCCMSSRDSVSAITILSVLFSVYFI